MELRALTDSAVEHFKAARYEMALKDFSEALELAPDHVKLLDGRAATNEKLGRLRSALQDAKGVINLKPDASKGYLRAARIYQGLGKLDTALSLVRAGQAAVKTSTKDLDEQAQKLEAAIKLKAASPLSMLPREIFVHALAYLGGDDRYRCTRVCRAWRQTINSSVTLWQDLRLHGDPQRHGAKMKCWLEKLDGAPLRSLHAEMTCPGHRLGRHHRDLLTFLGSSEAAGLQKLVYVQPELSLITHADQLPGLFEVLLSLHHLHDLELHLRCNMALPTSLPEFVSALGPLRQLRIIRIHPSIAGLVTLDTTPSLLNLRQPSMENTSLLVVPECRLSVLHSSQGLNFEVPGGPEQSTDPLGRDLHGPASLSWYSWPHLVELTTDYDRCELDALHMAAMAAGQRARHDLPSLRDITIHRGTPTPWYRGDINFKAPILRRARFVNLESWMITPLLTNLAAFSPFLESLSMASCALRVNGSDLAVGRWPQLVLLDVSSTSFDDDALQRLPTVAPALQSLIANNCTALTSGPLMRYVDGKKGQLQELSVDACPLLKPEAIEWLRKVVPRFSGKVADALKVDKSWRGKFT